MVVNTWGNVTASLYSLFVNYTFGDIYIAAGFLIFYILALGYMLKLGADAMAIVFVGLMFIVSVAVFGNLFIPILVVILGFVIYLGLARLKSMY